MTFDLVQLRNLLDKHFNENDLRDLCFELGIDYENLPPGGKRDKARELVQYTERLGRTDELVEHCRQLRPRAGWPAGAGTTHPAPTTSTVSSIPLSPPPSTVYHPLSALPSWVPKLVFVPAGLFLMGSSDTDRQANNNETPQHRLNLPDYWIGKTPITNAQFRPFLEGDGYHNKQYWTPIGWQ